MSRLILPALLLAACAGGETEPRRVGPAPDAAPADARTPPRGDRDALVLPPDAAPLDGGATRDAAGSGGDAGPLADARPGRDGDAPLADAARPGPDGGPGGADAAPPGPDAAPPPPDAAPRPDAAAPRPDAAPPRPDAAPPRQDAAPPAPDAGCAPRAETCNGADDDCDGRVDEDPVCGPWAERSCRVTLGWADNQRGPVGVSPTWSACPGADRQMGGDVRCTTTQGDGRFVRMDLDGDVDDNDQLAVAFRCADPDFPDLATWAQSNCAVFLGWADNNRGPADSDTWGLCPNAITGVGDLRCTSSGFDGRFRAMTLGGDVDENDDLGIAFVCRDAADPGRATAFAQSVAVHIAWAPNSQGPADGADQWTPDCPGEESVRVGRITVPRRCAQSLGDGRFHRLDLGRDINDDDDLGLALKRR